MQSAAIAALRAFTDPFIEEGIRRLENVRQSQPLLAPRVNAVIDGLRKTPGFGVAAQ